MIVCLLACLLTCCAFIGLISSKDEAKASEQQTWTTIFLCVTATRITFNKSLLLPLIMHPKSHSFICCCGKLGCIRSKCVFLLLLKEFISRGIPKNIIAKLELFNPLSAHFQALIFAVSNLFIII